MISGGSAGSVRDIGEARPADIVLLDANGDPVFGFDPTRPGTATLTNVALSTTSVVLAAANADRRQLIIANDSNRNLRVAFDATATATAFTVLLAAGAHYEAPLDGYTGVVSGIWQSAGSGAARVTEIE